MSKVAILFGLGPRIGQAVVNKFLREGYKVATVSRAQKTSEDSNSFHVMADLADPSSVEPVFKRVQERWGSPSVVIYNAAAYTPTPINPLSATVAELNKDLNINTVSAYAAASIGYSLNKEVTFLYTGNGLNSMVILPLTTAGVGKSGTAHWIQAAAKADHLRPATFYYVDQRHLDGTVAGGDVDGEAHAEEFLKLVNQKEQGDPIHVFRA
ncbi:uncharacterized protein I303_103275 [Kwoniella dejecticola CBS 10117]|uniref:Short-chain dehydrogenase n=1 Tax=Kwoniella dejecticola CBS 10117 TaxID=1296121 RepID=A0A1A6A6A2_9TREE|nr:uncharacterized protein I303_03298 [Kwoniella dejecticola CBS 10117]OBR85587.1 hypothetical protein I303_03298 [Kwoniella dejecticola CBS 10117]